MSDRAPVERSYVVRDASPREVYDVVVDFQAYPRLFPEFKAVRVLPPPAAAVATQSGASPPAAAAVVIRVEFRVEVVLKVRYVLDLICDPEGLTVDWSYVEGEVVVDSTGHWGFAREGQSTRLDYRASVVVKAPLPGFIVRKATDALVAASLPNMFAAIDREVRARRAARLA